MYSESCFVKAIELLYPIICSQYRTLQYHFIVCGSASVEALFCVGGACASRCVDIGVPYDIGGPRAILG